MFSIIFTIVAFVLIVKGTENYAPITTIEVERNGDSIFNGDSWVNLAELNYKAGHFIVKPERKPRVKKLTDEEIAKQFVVAITNYKRQLYNDTNPYRMRGFQKEVETRYDEEYLQTFIVSTIRQMQGAKQL